MWSRDNQTGSTKHKTQGRRRRDVTQAPGRYISACLKGSQGPQEKTPAIACKRLFFCFNTWARSRPGGVETRRGCLHIEYKKFEAPNLRPQISSEKEKFIFPIICGLEKLHPDGGTTQQRRRQSWNGQYLYRHSRYIALTRCMPC